MKSSTANAFYPGNFVAPLVGVWIEIICLVYQAVYYPSLPSWECGLKYFPVEWETTINKVAPLVGVWIEMMYKEILTIYSVVAPLVGVWIEIMFICTIEGNTIVAPLVGVWIEIFLLFDVVYYTGSRSPRGSVD